MKSEKNQVKRVRAFRRKRNARRASAACARLEQAAAGSENLMPHIVAAVEAGATVGETATALKNVFGEAQHARTI